MSRNLRRAPEGVKSGVVSYPTCNGSDAGTFRRWFYEVLAEPVPPGVTEFARLAELEDMRQQLAELEREERGR